MTRLDSWLKQATRYLSKDSVAQVRTEIQEHYESAREAAMARPGGVTPEEADRLALAALGDAKAANRQYRKVLLTSTEAKMLRDANWEARAVCSRAWLKWLFRAMSVTALLAGTAFFFTGSPLLAWTLLAGGIAIGLLFTAPFLPVYTPSRGRVFRYVKWVVLLGTLGLAFGTDAHSWSWLLMLKWSWLLTACLWPLIWIEWTRVSIRRKIPIAQWPRQLYL
jgi:hypothetical protein